MLEEKSVLTHQSDLWSPNLCPVLQAQACVPTRCLLIQKKEGFHIGQELRHKHSKPQRGVSIPPALPDHPTLTVLFTHQHGANWG